MGTAVVESPPSAPRGHFLWGHGRAFNRDPLGFLARLGRKYGDFVPLRFTPFRGAFLNHPDLIEELFVTKHRSFVKPLNMRRFAELVGNGLGTSEGDFWRRQRRLMQPAFHRERLAAYGAVMVSRAESLLSTWCQGEEREIQKDMQRVALEVVCESLFGTDVAGEAAEVGAAFTAAMEALQVRMNGLQLLLPPTVPTPARRRLTRAARRLDALVYRIIQGRRASGEERGDLLSLLLQAQDEDGTRMTDQQLRDEVISLVGAGHETTALALTWAWYLLSQHPEAETRVHAELDRVLGGRAPTAADLPELAYTGMVVTETLRLFPPAWGIARDAREDTEIGGYRVTKGTIVIASQWTMHRDPRYFEDPEAFRPERWAEGLAKRLPRFAYFPFGGGPRQCIGNHFALMEATLVLATIAQRYRLTLVPGQDVTPKPVVFLRPKDGIRMALHRR